MADIFQTAFDEICTQLGDVGDGDIVTAVLTPPAGDVVTVIGHFAKEPDFQASGMNSEYIEHELIFEANVGEFSTLPVPGWAVAIGSDTYEVTSVESDGHQVEMTLR